MNILPCIRLFLKLAGLVAICVAVLSGLGALVKCTPPAPIWAMALAAAAAFATTAAAYRRERSFISRRTGVMLLALRSTSILAVIIMLMQPVLIRNVGRKVERTVAILVDTSDSMRFEDRNWSPGESLSLATELDLLDGAPATLRSIRELDESCRELRPWLEHPFPDSGEPEACRRISKRTIAIARSLGKELSSEPFASSSNSPIARLSRILDNSLIPALGSLGSANFRNTALSAIDATSEILGSATMAADNIIWDSLAQGVAHSISNAITTNRLAIAAMIAEKTIATLSSDYSLRHFSFARHATPVAPGALRDLARDPSQSSSSDFTAALEEVMEAIPGEELAGLVLLTDGLSNGDSAIEPVARRLASRGVKASTIMIGSSTPPCDLAISDISAPESVFLGDKVRIRSKLWAARCSGEKAHVSLMLDGVKVDETSISIPADDFECDFSLAFAPTNSGLARFSLEIDQIEGERFPSNNVWAVDVAVSDDRTNVLLVDDYPRWDFRYLRNLFFARDKSVHLQYLLLHPDTIADLATTNKPPAASASRPFGEAEAGSLPTSIDEWRKFDVIILGDIGPDTISNELAQAISECVADRGALLVTIAGPRAMPHAFPDNSPLRAMLPVDYPPFSANAKYWEPPEDSFMPTLTAEGRLHQIVQQSSSASENEQIWKTLQPCSWRMPASGVKAGAEIIAYAKANGDENDPVTATDGDIDAILAERNAMARNSLIVAHNFGKGKVLALNTDESWRLRYRIGDTRHHRFWGQVLRWGLGERLRSGDARLRLGTEKLTYSPTDAIRLLARIADKDGNPVNNAKPVAVVSHSVDAGTTNGLFSAPLSLVKGSQGLYEAFMPPLSETGAYSFRIMDSERYSAPGADPPSATFFIASSRRPIEMARVAASTAIPDVLAQWTGGKVLSPADAKSLEGAFGEKSRVEIEMEEIPLWNGKWLLFMILLLLTAEWVLRKRHGLV